LERQRGSKGKKIRISKLIYGKLKENIKIKKEIIIIQKIIVKKLISKKEINQKIINKEIIS